MQSNEAPFLKGTVWSVVAHFTVILFFVVAAPRMGDFGKPVVYSVTIEGGKKLGGIQQVPQSDKTTLAPPKNVAAPEPSEKRSDEKKPDQKKEDLKVEKEKEDAEVSLKEKQPTPKATEAPKKDEKGEKGKEDDSLLSLIHI